eukprot:TRINITY_DN107978_c0_g1_i1.p1 TRINITY_DN107978_c0_g1~~TRINITY_DN107978_c0_g1_i1.p1  ORF type:complete len:192 (+),score=39.69 TRINITY_DN107978_c0_g1_i1:71-646(+)
MACLRRVVPVRITAVFLCMYPGALAIEVTSHAQLEVESTGASKPHKDMMRREATFVHAEKGGVALRAEAGKIDEKAASHNSEAKKLYKDDCTGLQEAFKCNDAEVANSAASCETFKSVKGGDFYRCKWRPSVPNHVSWTGEDLPMQDAECMLDIEAGICSTRNDASDADPRAKDTIPGSNSHERTRLGGVD